MADPTPPPAPAQPAPKVPPPRNQALRMLGLPALPKKLPSRNWMIFWTITTTVSAAIIYDKREKKRATARWAHAVEHLAKESLPNGLGQVRKLTIYLSSPPGDGLRFSQDHYTEYVKPILGASGLDWEFVQGRREGDVRAVVAEKVRKVRRGWESNGEEVVPDREPTREEVVERIRKERGIDDYDGVRGDVVIGRHTWKEYVRGLHEGWLGPLAPPPVPEPLPESVPINDPESTSEEKPAEEKPAEEKQKPKGPPPQPKPYNTTNDYPAESLPLLAPGEFTPAAPIREPHILGFLNTPKRMYRFFNRRALADEIGRDVAAVCFGAYREFREEASPDSDTDEMQYEQQKVLAEEEKDWIKTVWKEDEPKEDDSESVKTERIRANPIVLDPRVAGRMRRFEILPEDEARARQIVITEAEVEGWIKGKLRQLVRWGASGFQKQQTVPLTDVDVE